MSHKLAYIKVNCECSSPLCCFHLEYDEEFKEYYPTIYVQNYKSFWKRLKIAFWYVLFGEQGFDIWGAVWSPEEVQKISNFYLDTVKHESLSSL